MPADAIVPRLQAGPFRVKSGIDLNTALRLVADLESLGAVCSIVDNAGRAVPRTQYAAPRLATQPPTGSLQPAQGMAQAQAGGRAQAGAGPQAQASPPVQAQGATPAAAHPAKPRPGSQSELKSGLAAALAAEPAQELGALSQGSAALSLATLDGEEEPQRRPGSTTAASSRDDYRAFAPPQEEAQALQLAMPVGSRGAHAAPPAKAPEPEAYLEDQAPPAEDVQAASRPVLAATGSRQPQPAPSSTSPGESPVARVRRALADSERVRFAAGILLALLLGFVPAHVFASIRERSGFAELDREVRQAYEQATDIEEWNALDGYREAMRERKETQRRNIALSSILVWALAGGALGYLWFRKIDWDRLRPP